MGSGQPRATVGGLVRRAGRIIEQLRQGHGFVELLDAPDVPAAARGIAVDFDPPPEAVAGPAARELAGVARAMLDRASEAVHAADAGATQDDELFAFAEELYEVARDLDAAAAD